MTTAIDSHSKSSYRPDIDGLRALAVIAVICNHFDKNSLPSGYLGVDIFFVISGFVITTSLAGRSGNNFWDFVAAFYVRRIKRLVPALVLFVVITGILICLFDPSPGVSLKTGIASLIGVSNLYLLHQATDYFAASTELNVFTHTWSLGVEEQFYVLFPVLVWLSGFGRHAANGTKNLLLIVGVLSAASLTGFSLLYLTNQPAAYFLMPTRIWELGAGCLVFLASRSPNWVYRLLSRTPPTLVTAALLVALFIPFQFAIPATVTVVFLTSALIVCVRKRTIAFALFTHRSVVYVGRISYSLYLWHWGVLALSRWTVGIQWWTVPLQIALMVLLAAVSYRHVETRFRLANWSAQRWQSILCGTLASTCAAGLLFGLTRMPSSYLYMGHPPNLVAVGVESLIKPYILESTESYWGGKSCILSSNSDVGKVIPIDTCTLGNFSTARRRILVLGNSFSAAFTQSFDSLVTQHEYAVTITSSWGASPVAQIPNKSAWAKANKYYWESVVPTLISNLRPGDSVFLINDLAEFSPKERFPNDHQRLQQLQMGLEIMSSNLTKRGIRLVVLHGIPFAREANCQPAAAVKQWFSPFGNHCRLPTKTASLLRRDSLDKMLALLEKNGLVRIVDLFNDVFCPNEECTYHAANGQVLYRDEYSHPSVEAARLSASEIRKVLTSEVAPVN